MIKNASDLAEQERKEEEGILYIYDDINIIMYRNEPIQNEGKLKYLNFEIILKCINISIEI